MPLLCLCRSSCCAAFLLIQATAHVPHPKMPHLVEVLKEHFAAHQQQAAAAEAAAAAGAAAGSDEQHVPDVTRAMVFITYRDQVAKVWQHLRQLEPDIMCRWALHDSWATTR